MTKEEIFKKANEKYKRDKDKKNTYDYVQLPHVALEKNSFKVVRILGNPLDYVEKTNFDCMSDQIAYIKGDNDRKFLCHFDPNPHWFLRKVINKVTMGKWEPSPDGKSRKTYDYLNTFPEIVQMVVGNGEVGNIYERGWFPQQKVYLPVIMRGEKIHTQEKTGAVLSKNSSTSDEGRVYSDPGVTRMLYNLI